MVLFTVKPLFDGSTPEEDCRTPVYMLKNDFGAEHA